MQGPGCSVFSTRTAEKHNSCHFHFSLRDYGTDYALINSDLQENAMTERDIFIAALQKENPAERYAYVAEVCAERPGLREQVEGLLRLYEEAGSFLEQPAGGQPDTGVFSAATADEAIAPSEVPGTILGPYKLI